MKIHEKIKIKNTRNRYIFCYNFHSIVNLRLKFWGYNEKNTSGYTLGDENVIGIRAFNISPKNRYDEYFRINSQNMFSHTSRCVLKGTQMGQYVLELSLWCASL